jgi:hypothetical protein
MHPYSPGDAIWVKEWNVQPLKPHWRGLFVIILSAPTTVKVADSFLDPLQLSQASFYQVEVHPQSGFAM